MKRLLPFLLLLFPMLAAAQSSPGFTYGQVPTSGQWNSYFAAKTDYTVGGVPVASGGTGATTASAARTNLGIASSAIYPIGTSGYSVPLLNAANAWSATQGFTPQTLPVTSTSAWNLAAGNLGIATLVNSISTLTFTSPPVGGEFRWKIIQAGAGSYTIAWPASLKWTTGSAPTLTTSIGGVDMITCVTFDTGTTYQCRSDLNLH